MAADAMLRHRHAPSTRESYNSLMPGTNIGNNPFRNFFFTAFNYTAFLSGMKPHMHSFFVASPSGLQGRPSGRGPRIRLQGVLFFIMKCLNPGQNTCSTVHTYTYRTMTEKKKKTTLYKILHSSSELSNRRNTHAHRYNHYCCEDPTKIFEFLSFSTTILPYRMHVTSQSRSSWHQPGTHII